MFDITTDFFRILLTANFIRQQQLPVLVLSRLLDEVDGYSVVEPASLLTHELSLEMSTVKCNNCANM